MTNIMNSTAFIEARRKAEEKLKELSLTEKIGQLSQFGTSIYTSEEKYFEDHFAEGKIGMHASGNACIYSSYFFITQDPIIFEKLFFH